MLVHGTEDTDVPYEQLKMMAERLSQTEVQHQFITVPGGGHGLGNIATTDRTASIATSQSSSWIASNDILPLSTRSVRHCSGSGRAASARLHLPSRRDTPARLASLLLGQSQASGEHH